MDKKQYTYDQLTLFLMVISFAGLALAVSIRYENDMERFQKELDYKQHQIDSLSSEIDTLLWNLEIWDYNMSKNSSHLLSAIMLVESSNNDSAYNPSEDAVGCLQIRKCMVDDVNRILRRQGEPIRFAYDDRWIRYKSIQMFDIYCKHYRLSSPEEIARCWNGGPRGINNPATVIYWEKVKNKINS